MITYNKKFKFTLWLWAYQIITLAITVMLCNEIALFVAAFPHYIEVAGLTRAAIVAAICVLWAYATVRVFFAGDV